MKRRHNLIITLLATVVLWITGTALAQDGLVGHWTLDDMSGDIAADSSGNGYDGEFNDEPEWTTGYYGGALEFSGSSDALTVPFTGMSVDQGTVAFWANIDADYENDTRYMFGHTTDPAYNDRIQVYMDGGTTDLDIGLGGTHALDTDILELETDTWFHICLIWSDGAYTVYLDGDEIADGSYSSLEEFADTADFGNNGSSGHDQAFTGPMDDFWLFNRALTPKEIAFVMAGGEDPGKAGNPSPANAEEDVALDATLSWKAGQYAVSHDVYFGTSFDDVNDASRSNPGSVLVSEGQSVTSFTPDGLVLDGEYYWRVDEVNANPSTIFKGAVWTFQAEPTYFTITPVVATASSYDVTNDFNYAPEHTIDGSGLLNDGKHSALASMMWRTAENDVIGAWIQYEFDAPYQFHQMHVWNYNGENEQSLGVGIKGALIETSMDGETWTALPEVELSRATGRSNYTGEDIGLNDVLAKYIRIEVLSQQGFFTNGAVLVQKTGLSEIQFQVIPIAARRPSPIDGGTVASLKDELTWRMGRGAETNRLYLNADANLVAAADENALIGEFSDRHYAIADTDAIYGQKYYWRVDQIAGDKVTAGAVWDFNTPDHLVIDDMEDYSSKNLIYETWLDGYDVDENGSEIGDGEPYVEQEIAFGGSQSMPMYYDTTDGEDAAWVELTVDSDIFSMGGVTQFSVMFKSDRTNDDGGQFYVEINNKRVYSPASLTSGLWTQLIADLSEFGNLNSADSLILGVNGQNLEGVVYIDEVCLYVVAPVITGTSSEQPGNDTLVVHYAMESNLQDSVGNRDGQSGSGLTLFYETSLKEGIMNLGKALALDGEETSYVDVNDAMDDLVPTLTNSTYTAWVSIAEDSDESWMRVFDFGTGTENYMFLSPRSGTGGSPEFGIISPDSPSAVEQDVAGPALLTSGWHHLAVTIEQGDPNGLLTLYVDGVAMDTDETDTLPADLGTTTQNWLGRSQWESDGYYNGLLDEIRIYSEALSEAEIRWLAGDQ